MFHKTLERLRQLQIIFNEKFDLEGKLLDLPKEVETHEKMVQQLKKEFLDKNEKYNSLKQESFLKKEDLRHAHEQREKLEKEIGQVSSQRDYERIDRAIKENEEFEHGLARELSVADTNFAEFQEEFENSEKFLKEQEQLLEKVKSQVEKQIMDAKLHLQELRGKETNITADLDEKLVFKFERIIKTKGGGGIVPIRKNVCYGCNMLLPLEFVNTVRKEESILTCPYCSKIVFYDGSEDSEEILSTEISGLQDVISEDDIEFDEFTDEDITEFLDKDEIGSDSYALSPNIEESSIMNDDEDDDDDDDDEEDEDEFDENDTEDEEDADL